MGNLVNFKCRVKIQINQLFQEFLEIKINGLYWGINRVLNLVVIPTDTF